MTPANYNPGILEEGLGAVAIVASIVSSPLSRLWYSRWGATPAEVDMTLPGDELVPDPILENTRAITIHAPASEVWPWLVQMGQGRGGLYSYERLENLVGCDIHNADQVLPEHQHLQTGDKVRLMPEGKGPFFVVTGVEPERAIILSGDEPPTSWVFVLQTVDDHSTRVIVRWRFDYEPTAGNVLMWRVFTDPINFVMERKMLQGIKRRAEAAE